MPRHPRFRRHLGWIVPLVVGVLLFLGGGFALAMIQPPRGAAAEEPGPWLVGLGFLAIAVLGPVAGVVVAVVNAVRLLRSPRTTAWRDRRD